MYYNRANLAYEVEVGTAEEIKHKPLKRKKAKKKFSLRNLLLKKKLETLAR